MLRPELHDEAMLLLYNLKYSKDPIYADAYDLISQNPTVPITKLQKRLRNESKRQLPAETLLKIATLCGLPHNPA